MRRYTPLRGFTLIEVMVAIAAMALMAAQGSAHATAGVWDSAALGHSGNGSNSANAWIATPEAGSSYAEWNVILSYPTDNTPDIAGAGTLTELTGGAFTTKIGRASCRERVSSPV